MEILIECLQESWLILLVFISLFIHCKLTENKHDKT